MAECEGNGVSVTSRHIVPNASSTLRWHERRIERCSWSKQRGPYSSDATQNGGKRENKAGYPTGRGVGHLGARRQRPGERGRVERNHAEARRGGGGTSGSHLPEWQGNRKWKSCCWCWGRRRDAPERGRWDRASDRRATRRRLSRLGPARTLYFSECIQGRGEPVA